MEHKPDLLDREFVEKRTVVVESDGSIGKQWFKTRIKEKEAYEQFREAVSSFADNPAIISKRKIKAPKGVNKELLSVYTIGDAHVGMLASANEVGQKTNLSTVQEDLHKAMELLVYKSDNSGNALIVDVGDWFHSDNQSNRTAHSGNALDVDGRYADVLEAGFMLAVGLIDLALEKHEQVTWRSAIGNHNEHSAIMMSAFLKAWYRNEDRVLIADTPSMFYYHTWGKNLIGITHGHTVKAEKLGEVMSVDCEELWSTSKYRYWYTGHVHHQSVKEFSNCVVETFCTLTGKDAWHSASGYRSNQSMKSITLHQEFGEIDRATVSLRMIRE